MPSETPHLLFTSRNDLPIFKNFATSRYLTKTSTSVSTEPLTRPVYIPFAFATAIPGKSGQIDHHFPV